jgi:hypothetical protein
VSRAGGCTVVGAAVGFLTGSIVNFALIALPTMSEGRPVSEPVDSWIFLGVPVLALTTGIGAMVGLARGGTPRRARLWVMGSAASILIGVVYVAGVGMGLWD